LHEIVSSAGPDPQIVRRSAGDFFHGAAWRANARAKTVSGEGENGVAENVPDAHWRHDLKNQLGIVLGYSELILQVLNQSNPMRTDVEEIMKAAQHALTLVRQLEPTD